MFMRIIIKHFAWLLMFITTLTLHLTNLFFMCHSFLGW